MHDQPHYADSVFINCPFDKNYEHLLHGVVFTVFRCGFTPRCALEEDDGLDMRLDKIVRLIKLCKYGIHDLSRVELDEVNALPRFNMPFELGVFLGAKKFGDKMQKEKNALVFEREKYHYQKYISDLSGVDVKAHSNQPDKIVKAIRNWLLTASKRKTIPSAEKILKDLHSFYNQHFPLFLKQSHMQLENITYNDYCAFVIDFLEAKEKI